MSSKSKTDLRRRNFISLESKIGVLDRLRKGDKVSRIARSLNLNEATIRTIRKNEHKIRTAVSAGSAISAKVAARPRQPIIEKMEKALIIWINDSCNKQIPIDGSIIKEKAIQIYNHLIETGELPVNPGFVASKGWLERFKKRFALPSTKLQKSSNAPTAIEGAADNFEEFQRTIEESGYTPYQVFNADEFSLSWKKIPSRLPCVKQEEAGSDSKSSDDRVTLLMCSNASGDCIIKPMLVYRSTTPAELQGIDKETLPVYWKANKPWVTVHLFKQWFADCFLPGVEKYLKQKNLSFKILLILDNAPCHPRDIVHSNVEVRFLASHSSIQPLDQGIISSFKRYYVRNFLQWILEKVVSESVNAVEAWARFSIVDSMEIVAASLNDLKPSTLNACWRSLWPEAVLSESAVEPVESEISAILEIARSIGGEFFRDATIEYIQELLLEKEIDEEVLDIESESSEVNTSDGGDGEKTQAPSFTLNSIAKGLHLADQLECYFMDTDPLIERSAKFRKELRKCLASYRKIYEGLLNETSHV